jgi:hypothetical protein
MVREDLARAAKEAASKDYVAKSVLSSTAVRPDPKDLQSAFERFIVVGSAGSGKSVLFADAVANAAYAFLGRPDTGICPLLIRGRSN